MDVNPSASLRSALEDRLESMLEFCVARDGSDLHLTPGLAPHLRVHGELDPIPGSSVLSRSDLRILGAALLARISGGLKREPQELDALLEDTGSFDGAFTARDGTRFRINIYRRQADWAVALRRLEERFQTLGELGLPESLYRFCDLRDGLIVISGPTGAGKSTTLATLIDRINRTRTGHIVTIEDPIEYLHHPVRCVVNQRQVGLDTPSFNDALVAALRQDPDFILVGEIRDLETIRTAITAAETGHLVFTTLHAGDCVSSVERLVSVFPADEQDGIRRQLSLVMRGIVAQHLLPAADHAAGVERRRVVASEILQVTPAIANLVATGKSAQIYSAMELGGGNGMQTLEQDLARLWTAGRIGETAAVAMARNVSVLRDRAELIRRRGIRVPAETAGRPA